MAVFHESEFPSSDPCSPKYTPNKIRKLKLNLDIPENDSEPEDSDCENSSAVDSKIKETETSPLTEVSLPTNTSASRIQDTKVEIKQLFPSTISETVKKNHFEFANIDRTPLESREISEVPLEASTETATGNLESSVGSEGRLGNWNGSKIPPSLQQLESLKLYSAPKSVPPKLLNGKDPASLKNPDKTQSLFCCTTSSLAYDANKSDSSSPPAKRCRVALHEVKSESLNPISAREDAKNVDVSQNRLEHSIQFLDLLDVSSCHLKTLETKIAEPQTTSQHHSRILNKHCTLSKTSILFSKILKIPFLKVVAFCSWLARKIISYINRVCINFRQNLVSNRTSQPDTSPLLTENLNQVLSTIRCENERIISILSEKVSHLSEELSQIKTSSEASLTALLTEVNCIHNGNKQLAENSTVLVNEIKSLYAASVNVKSVPNKMSQLPPPPPPPPPPSMQKTKTPMSPSSNRGLRKTPRKCSSPILNRPCITVEDLLKVRLKKAPQNSKENRRSSIPGPRGPVVSLDMLSSVKLRSARRRPCDQNTRSPRSRSAFMRSRVNASLRISPISTGSESSLDRILKQVDINRTESKRTLSSPMKSDSDFSTVSSKAISPFRFNRSHSLVVTSDFA